MSHAYDISDFAALLRKDGDSGRDRIGRTEDPLRDGSQRTHSDLETTLNVYTHAIPDAQRRAVDKVAEVLFTNVHEISAATENQKVN